MSYLNKLVLTSNFSVKGIKFEHILAKYNTLDFFHDHVSKHADTATPLEMALFLKLSKTYRTYDNLT